MPLRVISSRSSARTTTRLASGCTFFVVVAVLDLLTGLVAVAIRSPCGRRHSALPTTHCSRRLLESYVLTVSSFSELLTHTKRPGKSTRKNARRKAQPKAATRSRRGTAEGARRRIRPRRPDDGLGHARPPAAPEPRRAEDTRARRPSSRRGPAGRRGGTRRPAGGYRSASRTR